MGGGPALPAHPHSSGIEKTGWEMLYMQGVMQKESAHCKRRLVEIPTKSFVLRTKS